MSICPRGSPVQLHRTSVPSNNELSLDDHSSSSFVLTHPRAFFVHLHLYLFPSVYLDLDFRVRHLQCNPKFKHLDRTTYGVYRKIDVPFVVLIVCNGNSNFVGIPCCGRIAASTNSALLLKLNQS